MIGIAALFNIAMYSLGFISIEIAQMNAQGSPLALADGIVKI